MNKLRRKKIEEISMLLSDKLNELEELLSEEQDYYDNMPESFQGGKKGEKAEADIDAIDNAKASLEEAIENLHEVIFPA